jgi:hypothetical protein
MPGMKIMPTSTDQNYLQSVPYLGDLRPRDGS